MRISVSFTHVTTTHVLEDLELQIPHQTPKSPEDRFYEPAPSAQAPHMARSYS
jgi:hypothetical protein